MGMSGVPLHPVPVDMNILKAVKRSSLGLDLNYAAAQGVLILWPSKPPIPPTRHFQLAE